MSGENYEESAMDSSDCIVRCQRFSEITSTNNAIAMFFLQDRDWDLEKAVSDYFAQSPSKTRTDEEMHVICLQEVVSQSLDMLRALLHDTYHIFSATDKPQVDCAHYFVALLVRRHPSLTVDQSSFSVNAFPGSVMGRHLLSVDINLASDYWSDTVASAQSQRRIRVCTSHLESCREGAAQRMAQLKQVWSSMLHTTDSLSASVFCGDLNLRDAEVSKLGGVPSGIQDAWQVIGSRPELCGTWDPRLNKNAARFGPQGRANWKKPAPFRYDRLYYSGHQLQAVDFGLRGLEQVPGMQCFPSDHWAILTRFVVH